MVILLPIVTAIVCFLSFFLFLRDTEEQEKQTESVATSLFPKSVWIYSTICIVFTVTMAAFFHKLHPYTDVWISIKRMTLLAVLWPIAYIDAKTYRIPNKFVLFGLICRVVILLFELFVGNEYIWMTLLSEAIAAVALLVAAVLCAFVVKNGVGYGDMKLFAVMGLLLGTEGIWGAVFLALIVSFFLAVFLLLTKKKTRKDAIPFGPAIVIGAYLSVCISGM